MSALGRLAATAGCLLMIFCGYGVGPVMAQAAAPAGNSPSPDDDAAPGENGDAAVAGDVRPFFFTASASLAQLYDSNAQGVANGRSGHTTQAQLNLGLHDQTARFKADILYSLAGNYHPDNDD